MAALTPFPYIIRPLNNLQPFTYQDGETYLRILEKMRVWLNNSLVPELESSLQGQFLGFQEGLANAEQTIIELGDDWTARYDAFIANFTEEIKTLNDAAVAGMVTGPGAVRTALDGLIDAEIGAIDVALKAYADNKDTALATVLRAEAATTAQQIRAEATNTAAALRNESNDLETELRGDLETKAAVDLIRGIYPPGPIDVVTIGDSYFSGYQPPPTPWVKPIPQVLVDQLNAKGLNQYRLHNYANNAGGYDTTIGGGDTYFDTQVTAAINNTAITNCRLIIVGGGRNDSNAGKDVYTHAKAIYQRLKTKWPKAMLVVFPMWTYEKFGSNQRKTFTSIFNAARDVGAVYDTNSLWVNTLTSVGEWIDTVPHPRGSLVDRYAHAIHSLIQGGSLPAQTTGLSVHSSSGVTAGVVTVDGFEATVSFQQYVGAPFDSSYVLATIVHAAMRPGDLNQYVVGYSGDGAAMTMYTIGAASGQIVVTNTAGQTGRSGLTASYPLGM